MLSGDLVINASAVWQPVKFMQEDYGIEDQGEESYSNPTVTAQREACCLVAETDMKGQMLLIL